MLLASLILNIVVLVPVCVGLLRDGEGVREALGPRQPGRQILLAIYVAILITSIVLLVHTDTSMAMGLLLVQVIYKFLSPLTVGTLRNPVVISNLLIATVHTITLVSLAT